MVKRLRKGANVMKSAKKTVKKNNVDKMVSSVNNSKPIIRRTKRTAKKVKVVGTQTYINENTGELIEMEVITVEDRDFNFHKLWLSHILQSLDIIGNKKTKLAFWILDNLTSENLFIMTQRDIREKTGISLQVINETMRALVENNFLQKVHNGVYRVNPDMIFKGSRKNRMNVLLEYKKQDLKIVKNKDKEN